MLVSVVVMQSLMNVVSEMDQVLMLNVGMAQWFVMNQTVLMLR